MSDFASAFVPVPSYLPALTFCPLCPPDPLVDPYAVATFCGEHQPALSGLDDAAAGPHILFGVGDATGDQCREIQALIR